MLAAALSDIVADCQPTVPVKALRRASSPDQLLVYRQLGLAVSPDDCSLALRGLQTLALRLDYLETATLEVARWLEGCPHVDRVLHPALPSCPGHDHWKRDFTGSASVFSFTFNDSLTAKQVENFLDNLAIFRIGLSWGGVTSLAVV